jgi:hypothetical protein
MYLCHNSNAFITKKRRVQVIFSSSEDEDQSACNHEHLLCSLNEKDEVQGVLVVGVGTCVLGALVVLVRSSHSHTQFVDARPPLQYLGP